MAKRTNTTAADFTVSELKAMLAAKTKIDELTAQRTPWPRIWRKVEKELAGLLGGAVPGTIGQEEGWAEEGARKPPRRPLNDPPRRPPPRPPQPPPSAAGPRRRLGPRVGPRRRQGPSRAPWGQGADYRIRHRRPDQGQRRKDGVPGHPGHHPEEEADQDQGQGLRQCPAADDFD